MVLERIKDGAERHLFDLDEDTRRLAFILCLPLVDGVFATLLVTGAINTFSDVVSIALTVFTGAGALAVLYSSTDSRQEAKRMVLKAAPLLVMGALLVSLVAPVFEQLFYIERLRYAAGLALLTIALHMFDVDYAEKLSVPAIIITGMLLSIRNPGAMAFSLEYVAPALLTSVTAVMALYAASFISQERMTLSYIKRGGGIVLVLIALSQFGVDMPSELNLAVFAVSVVVSLRQSE
ncbi:MAG: DUF5794 domain-containing protein [Candidatus Nanohaloarchaea archaeon]